MITRVGIGEELSVPNDNDEQQLLFRHSSFGCHSETSTRLHEHSQ